MVDIRIKYVKRVVRRNKRRGKRVYYYYQHPALPKAYASEGRPGQRRILIPYDLERERTAFIEFIERWRLRCEGVKARQSAPAHGSFAHLAEVYRGNAEREIAPSREWKDLSDRSRKDYSRYVDLIVERWEPYAVAALEPEAVLKFRDSMEATPYKANYALAVLRKMIQVALQRSSTFGLRINPAENISKLGTKAGVRARHGLWIPETESAFLEAARDYDPEIYIAYHLLAYTGQRPGDVRAMQVSQWDGKDIRVRQSKTDARVQVPVHRALKAVLEAHLAERKKAGRVGGTILQTAGGEKFKERYFAERWDTVLELAAEKYPELNLLALQRRDLRRTAVVRLFEAGCTVPMVAAITGHTIKSAETIIETYFVRSYPLAAEAMARWEAYKRKKEG